MTFADVAEHKEFFALMAADEVFSQAVCVGVAFILGDIDMVEGEAIRQRYEALVADHEDVYGNGVMALVGFYVSNLTEATLATDSRSLSSPRSLSDLFPRKENLP